MLNEYNFKVLVEFKLFILQYNNYNCVEFFVQLEFTILSWRELLENVLISSLNLILITHSSNSKYTNWTKLYLAESLLLSTSAN